MRVVFCGTNEVFLSKCSEVLTASPYVEVVGVVLTAENLMSLIAVTEIDICIIGPFWMWERAQAIALMESAGVAEPKWVVATFHLTGGLCLEAAHVGIDDVVDLREGFEKLGERLLLLANGYLETPDDRPVPSRWIRDIPHVGQAIRDEFDAQIVRRLLRGETNTEIATAVHLSYQTVNNRISQMIHRTGTTNRTQLALLFADVVAPVVPATEAPPVLVLH